MSQPSSPGPDASPAAPPLAYASATALQQFVQAVLRGIGADDVTAQAATKAMMHGSLLGIDSHGVRLLPHYVRVIEGGRVNARPHMTFSSTRPGSGTLDADNGHGALAGFTAMEHALCLARTSGIGAVAVRRSSHFGAAGAYALAAAEAGLIGIATCNSDAAVHLHGSRKPFHGTNPFAVAVPVGGDDPWLFDFATSSIPPQPRAPVTVHRRRAAGGRGR